MLHNLGGAVIGLQIEDAVGSVQARAALDENGEGSAHTLKPCPFRQRFECDEALLEVVLALLGGQHSAGMRNDFVASHGSLRSSVQDSGLGRGRPSKCRCAVFVPQFVSNPSHLWIRETHLC